MGDYVVDVLSNVFMCVVINELELNTEIRAILGICPWPWIVRIVFYKDLLTFNTSK